MSPSATTKATTATSVTATRRSSRSPHSACGQVAEAIDPIVSDSEADLRIYVASCGGRKVFWFGDSSFSRRGRDSNPQECRVQASGSRLYADRTAGGYSHHCDSCEYAASGVVAREREGQADELLKQPQANGHRALYLCA